MPTTITFEYADLVNGFFVAFSIPYSAENMLTVLWFPESRNIRVGDFRE